MSNIIDPTIPPDRSKYREIFRLLQSEQMPWNEWILLDTVRGGGLRYRLENRRYVGLAGLEYLLRSRRVPGGKTEVFILITGREDPT